MSILVIAEHDGAELKPGTLNTVAAAVEEMSASLNEVARSSAQAATTATDATQAAQSTSETMDALGKSAKSIGASPYGFWSRKFKVPEKLVRISVTFQTPAWPIWCERRPRAPQWSWIVASTGTSGSPSRIRRWCSG